MTFTSLGRPAWLRLLAARGGSLLRVGSGLGAPGGGKLRRRCYVITFEIRDPPCNSGWLKEKEMDWAEIFKIAVGAGIGTAVVEGAFSLFQYVRTNRNHGAFLAFRLAIQLEAYARKCLSQMHDMKNYMSSRAAIGHLYCYLPDFPDFPDDADGWRNVSPQILDQAYRLRADAESEQSTLNFYVAELGEVEAAFSGCYQACAKTGLAALAAAQSFRHAYGFKTYSDDTREQLEGAAGSEPNAIYSYEH